MKSENKDQMPKDLGVESSQESKCHHCGEAVEVEWEYCPNCENSLMFNMCSCGEKIQSHWKVCPACGKQIE